MYAKLWVTCERVATKCHKMIASQVVWHQFLSLSIQALQSYSSYQVIETTPNTETWHACVQETLVVIGNGCVLDLYHA